MLPMGAKADYAQKIAGQPGTFSGLNNFLDVQAAFKLAQQEHQYKMQQEQQSGKNAGYASIINSSNINGVDPTQPLQQFNSAVNNNGVLPPNPQQGASSLANGATPPDVSNPSVSVTNTPGNPNGITVTGSLAKSTGTGRNEDYLAKGNFTPERKALIQRIADYKENPATLSRGNAGRALSGQVSAYDPNFDASQYATRQQFINNSWNKGEISKQRFAIENLTQHSAKLSDAFDELNNGQLLIANAGTNEAKRQTGNAQVVKAAQLERVAGVEMAKTLNTSGVLTNEQFDEAMKGLNNAASPDQMHTAIHTMMVAMQPRMNSILERYKEVMGKYPKFGFTPESLGAIQKIAPDVYNDLAPKLGVQGFVDAGNQVSGNQSSGQTGQNKVGKYTFQ